MRNTHLFAPEVRVYRDAAAVADAGAEVFARTALRSVVERGVFHVALSGGATPTALHQRIARWKSPTGEALPWKSIHIYFGDERCVPPDHADSNFRQARETLLARTPIPEGNVHRMKGELDPPAAAEDYEAQLKRVLPLRHGAIPRFDLIFLGLGQDGHTASLFPGTAALEEKHRLVVAQRVEARPESRLTLTYPVLNHAGSVLFLVVGAAKAPIMRRVLQPGAAPLLYPCQMVRPTSGWLRWFVDEAAASELR